MNEISSRMEESHVFEQMVSDLDRYRTILNEIKAALGVHEMQDPVFCLEAIARLKPDSAVDNAQRRGHVSMQNDELKDRVKKLEKSLVELRHIGGKLAQNVRDSSRLYPEKWNVPAVEQVLAQWKEVIDRIPA